MLLSPFRTNTRVDKCLLKDSSNMRGPLFSPKGDRNVARDSLGRNTLISLHIVA